MSIYTKVLEVQKKVGAIKKDKENPFFKSNYADINNYIDVLKPILNEVGLIVMQPLDEVNGKLAVKTAIVDPEDSENTIWSIAVLPENNDPQKVGAIITYFRRYALQSLFFLQAEDDDANSVSSQSPQDAPQSTKRTSDGEYVDCWNNSHCGGKHDAKWQQCYKCKMAGLTPRSNEPSKSLNEMSSEDLANEIPF